MNIRQELLSVIKQLSDEELSALLDLAVSLKKQKNAAQSIPLSQDYQDWLSAENDIYDELFADEFTAIEVDDLSSDKGIDYQKLRDLLKTERWKEADEETTNVMLKASGREEEGCLTIQSINKIPCTDLRTINRLWVKYTNGHFGFSVQKQIWESVGGKLKLKKLDDYYDYVAHRKFGEIVGWYVKEKDDWKSYTDLTFSLNAPTGHLPTVPVESEWFGEGLSVRISSLASRLVDCNL